MLFLLTLCVLVVSGVVGYVNSPQWVVQKVAIDADLLADDANIVLPEESGLQPLDLQRHSSEGTVPEATSALVCSSTVDGESTLMRWTATTHYGIWSLFPALVAVLFCWLTREPLTSLVMGLACGALLLGQYDFTEEVLLPSLSSSQAAGILILYLWLLGGLLGVWSRTGAAAAFAEFVTRRFVRGPRSARLVAWGLGVLFFQGGTVSTVLVGTTVKPIADQHRVSHEELSYIVDSTASPIACLIAFNAWPGYVQALIYVPGVVWLAEESSRIAFFFQATPYSLYAIFAVLGTLLLSLDLAPFLGRKFRAAIHRARTTGALDAAESNPLTFTGGTESTIPDDYQPTATEFVVPLLLLIGTAILSFIWTGSPQVRWAFGLGLLTAIGMALFRGMTLPDLVAGLNDGLRSVVFASVILLLAITMGGITRATGGGPWLVDLLGESIPFWCLPGILFAFTLVIAFSTGTSWGTYAVAFPLAMPLAISIGQAHGLADPKAFALICFAAVLNGSVFGDQCSPISDTTVLSAMTTGCDLMDHVLTQIVPASLAGLLAVAGWTVLTFTCL